jgi:serine/threonine protein kinase/WD40 repeat protein
MAALSEDAIFEIARQINSRVARDAYLDQACDGNEVLRARLEELLAAHDTADSRLDDPILEPTAENADSYFIEREGDHIGPYKLRERLGEGGMGVVWAAEQKRPLRRKVAVKLIKPGMDTSQVIARFEAEREALSLMDHPNIARVLDAGTTDQGRPYFVMELICGLPITEFCDQKRLTVSERMELFLQVCRAVQHAHQKGIIHRDIKPSNVLVTVEDDRPVSKVIDFGVAKALRQPLTDQSIYTGLFQAIGTLAYMSPEQAQLSGVNIDTRADIYGMGVLLYELLTGVTPFDKDTLASAALDEACRMIREQEPPRPSVRLSSMADRSLPVAAQRKVRIIELERFLRGDLDWIVMKALEKDRSRRYETASGFAADIERFLNNEPIEARPPSTSYRLRKVAARHRGALAVSLFLVVVLVLATAVSSYQAVLADRARKLAEAQGRIAEHEATVAENERVQTVLYAKSLEKQLYVTDTGLAWRYLGENNSDAAHYHLSRHLRDSNFSDMTFDYRYVWSECHRQNVTSKPIDNLANSVAFSHDGKLLAVSDIGGVVTVWEVAKLDAANPRKRIKCNYGLDEYGRNAMFYTPLAFSPTEDVLAYLDDDISVVRLLDLSSDDEDVLLKGHLKFVTGIDFSPDGKLVATVSEDGTCRLWDVDGCNCVSEYALNGEELWSVVFSPDGKSIAMGTNTGSVIVWEFDEDTSDTLQSTMVRSQGIEYPTEYETIWQLSYSPDGSLLAAACGDATVKLWRLNDREQHILAGHIDQVRGVGFADGGTILVSASRDDSVKIWDVASLREIQTIRGFAPGIQNLDVHDTTVATAVANGTFGVISLDDVAKDDVYAIHLDRDGYYAQQVAFTPDSRKIVVHIGRVMDPSEVRLFDMETRQLGPSVFDVPVDKISVSRDGELAAISHSGKVLTVDLVEGGNAEPLTSLKRSPAKSLCYDSDGQRLAIGRGDGHIELWDMVERSSVDSLKITDGEIRHIAIGRGFLVVGSDAGIDVWNVRGKKIEQRICREYSSNLAFSAERELLAYEDTNRQIVLVDLKSANGSRRERVGGGDPLYRKADKKLAYGGGTSYYFIDGGRTLVSVGWDGRVRFWSTDPFQERMSIIQAPRRIKCAALSPDGKTFVTGGQRYIRLYHAASSR